MNINIYRQSTLGQALKAALDKLVERDELQNQADRDLIWQAFDETMNKKIEDDTDQQRYELKGNVTVYQNIPLTEDHKNMRLMMIVKDFELITSSQPVKQNKDTCLKIYALQDPSEKQDQRRNKAKIPREVSGGARVPAEHHNNNQNSQKVRPAGLHKKAISKH